MGAKKKSSSSEKQLKATNKKLKANAGARGREGIPVAEEGEEASGRPRGVPETRHQAGEEARGGEAHGERAQRHPRRADRTTEVVVTETSDTAGQPTSTPDMSWTVVRLRAEARARGLTGLSSKPKAEILAALT